MPDARKMALELRPVNIDRLMRDLSLELSVSVGSKDVEVLFSFDPKLPPSVRSDALRLRQVLLNLASNAIKFTEHGEVVIALRLLATDGQTADIEFSVRDTGIGIPAEQQAGIFERFSQGEASTTRRFGGTSLGLTISQSIVELMGGTIVLDSTPGVGSRFHFVLALAIAQDDEIRAELRTVTGGRQLRALVVDDNASTRDVLQTIAQGLNWRCDCAVSGAEALALLQATDAQATPYDMILIDWDMPAMDGCETIRRVRNMFDRIQLPAIILVTAHGCEALAQRPETEAGMLNGFLMKPVTASMLYDAAVGAIAGSSPQLRSQGAERSDRLYGLRLLVVEDNALNQQVAKELLEHEGADVALADGGVAAVRMALEAAPPFDAILMDIQMPDMDGLSVTRLLRQDVRMQQVPIIAMTANVFISDREACVAAGMNDHIAKPISVPDVVSTLLQHCRGQVLAAVLPAPETAPRSELIDHALALRCMAGNEVLYARTAANFVRDAPALLARLDPSVGGWHTKQCASLLHTLKGMAATVGAQQLADLAGLLETELRAGAPADVGQRVAGIVALGSASGEALGPLIAQVVITVARPRRPYTAQDREELPQWLEQLELLLQRGNMRALDHVSRYGNVFEGVLGEKLMLIAESTLRFDFDGARELCLNLHKELP